MPTIRTTLACVLAIGIVSVGCNSKDVTTQPGAIASVSVSGPSTVRVGQTIRLTASAADANGVAITGQTFMWSSGNAAVATVASDGTVAGNVPGSATISATVSGISGSANITVTP